MDTGTHLLCGVGIAFLAKQFSPEISQVTFSLIAFTLIMSNSPDFDVVTKLFGNRTYIKNHRGLTHTMMMWPIQILIFSLIFYKLIGISYITTVIIGLVSVSLHLLLDCLNSYGTKLFPNGRWIRLSVIHTFDPIFTGLLLISAIVSIFFVNIFLLTFILLIIYVLLRFFYKLIIIHNVDSIYQGKENKIILIPTSKSLVWYVAVEFPDKFETFKISYKKQKKKDIVKREKMKPEQRKTISTDKIFTLFKQFSPMYNVKVTIHNNKEEVILTDMRYRSDYYYYFNATFILNNNSVESSYIGWVFDDKKRIKKAGDIK